jgi:hypothetical protein
MQDKFVQAIRYKLQKRVRRLNSADYTHFPFILPVFFKFFDSMPLLAGIRDELLATDDAKGLEGAWERIMQRQPMLGETEVESAALGYLILKQLAETPDRHAITQLARAYGVSGTFEEQLELVRTIFLEPFYEYVDEHIDDQQAILYFLRRYKHRCEWFQADRLRQAVQDDTRQGEKHLASDLYEYLHEQGIDFHIEPHSVSGIADFVADQVGEERVIADAKLFWPDKSKGKQYIITAFNQAYTYARDYNEPCAYLVIFKICKEDLNFLVPARQTMFPCLNLNNKTIFFIVVDLCEYGVPASKRGPLTSLDISENELVQSLENPDSADTRQVSRNSGSEATTG